MALTDLEHACARTSYVTDILPDTVTLKPIPREPVRR
jgi:hypothetical protein